MAEIVGLPADALLQYLHGSGTEKRCFVKVTAPLEAGFTIYPFVSVSPNGLPDGLHNMDAPFHNAQTITADGPEGEHFTAASGTEDEEYALAPLGLALAEGGALFAALFGGTYKQGTRFYFEDGIIALDPPFILGALGYHDYTHPAIRIRIVVTGDDVHFQIQQWDGAAVASHDFNEGGELWKLPVSVDHVEPIYYRLLRTYDGAGSGAVSLYVEHSGGSGELGPAFTFTYEPAPSTGFPPSLGALAIHNDQNVRIAWWRASSSDTDDDPGGFATWSDPVLFETMTATPSGDDSITWMDSGLLGAFWNKPTFHNIADVGGAMLEGRFAAADFIPAGNLSSMFAGGWTRLVSGHGVDLAAPGLQGRYLLVQLRHTPSTTVPLGGGPSVVIPNSAGEAAFAAWLPVAWPTVTEAVQITLAGERASEGALPVKPDFPARTEHQRAAVSFEMDGPYRTSYALQTSGRRRWAVAWRALTTADRDTLMNFFHARRWGEGTFDFEPPEGGTAAAHLIGDSVREVKLGPNAWALAAELEEVLR